MKTKNEVEKTKDIVTAVKKGLVLYLAVVTYAAVPLYMERGYFGLIEAKALLYRRLAAPALIAAIVIGAAGFVRSAAAGKGSGFRYRPRTSSVFLILIGGWALLSSCLSYNYLLSMTGQNGWAVGSLMIGMLVISTIFIARNPAFERLTIMLMAAVNVFVIMLAVVQSAGADPFGLLKNLMDAQYHNYLSTIGNVNSFCGYLCLILPLFWGGFLSCGERSSEILYGAISALGFMGIILTHSDSLYAGMGICLLFIVPYAARAGQYVKRAGILLFMFGGCLLSVRYVPAFSDAVSSFTGVSRGILAFPAAELMCLCGVLLFFWGENLIGRKGSRMVWGALEAALLFIIAAYALHSAVHFDDNWGNGRGAIWRAGWEYFARSSLRTKLVGIGPEMLFITYAKYKVDSGRNVLSAHSEPLQVLLSQGIVGLSLYIGFWGYLLKLFFGNKLWRKNAAVFFFPLAAYWGQSLFCSVYPVTAVVFSFAAGMYLRAAEEKA